MAMPVPTRAIDWCRRRWWQSIDESGSLTVSDDGQGTPVWTVLELT